MTGVRSFVGVVGLLVAACTSRAQEQKLSPASPLVRDVTASDYAAPKLPLARVILTDAYGEKHAVQVEVAATRESRTRGLMWRTRLDEGEAATYALFNDKRHKAILTDDGELIKLCKLEKVPFDARK